ncbi:hypothetical protein ACQWFV_25570, partial [Salmonella enterica subsp. enterica serovar Infantis]
DSIRAVSIEGARFSELKNFTRIESLPPETTTLAGVYIVQITSALTIVISTIYIIFIRGLN